MITEDGYQLLACYKSVNGVYWKDCMEWKIGRWHKLENVFGRSIHRKWFNSQVGFQQCQILNLFKNIYIYTKSQTERRAHTHIKAVTSKLA